MEPTAAKKALIVYATASGNTELVADCVCAGMNEAGLETYTVKVERTNPEEVAKHDLIVLMSPTYNVGKLQEYFEPFYKEFTKLELKDKPMAVVGLGFSDFYDIFCGAADYLEEAVKKVGGNQIKETLRIDGFPHMHLEEFKQWGKDLVNNFNNLGQN